MGRNSSRISRRIANSREGANAYGQISDDEEQDADWKEGEKRKKKIQPVRTNGGKKNGKSS
jgi:SAGA-associated factor 11